MPVIDVCTVPTERVREMEREAEREREREREIALRVGVADGTRGTLHPRSGTLLKYEAVITG